MALIGVTYNEHVRILARSHDVPASVERALLYLMEQAISSNQSVERPATAALGGPVIIMPLTAEHRPVGALALVGTSGRSHFRPDEVERLTTFADQASIAIGQAQLYARAMESKRHAESRLAQLEALNTVARTFVTSLDAHRLLADFVRQLAAVLPMTHAAIFLNDHEGGEHLWPPVYQWPNSPLAPLAINDVPEVQRALSRGDLVHVLPLSGSSPQAAHLAQQWGVRAYLIVPLRTRQQPVGVLLVGHAQAEPTITAEEAQLATSLASFAAAAVENLRLYEELDQKSRQLAAIVRDIGDGVIVADAHLRIMLVNPAARAISA
ncbi:MAG: GAF domain-containing protein [Ardenticatenia bacterium]|nr:GAF domain-containing protein [Ardenticatenia bacterium]